MAYEDWFKHIDVMVASLVIDVMIRNYSRKTETISRTRTCMRNSGMGTNSFFGAISLFVSIFPFVHTVERARSLYVFTLSFLRVKPPDMCKVEKSCSKAEKVEKCPEYSGQLRTALSSSGQLQTTLGSLRHL